MNLPLHSRYCAKYNELEALAQRIVGLGKDVIVLSGVVGSGKTTLAQAILFALRQLSLESTTAMDSSVQGTLDSSVRATSPTFSLMHDYGGMCHYDLYRRTSQEVLGLGLLEWLSGSGMHCIEWGEELLPLLVDSGFACVLVKITDAGQRARMYEIYAEI